MLCIQDELILFHITYNAGIPPCHHTVSEPKRQLESSSLWKSQILQCAISSILLTANYNNNVFTGGLLLLFRTNDSIH